MCVFIYSVKIYMIMCIYIYSVTYKGSYNLSFWIYIHITLYEYECIIIIYTCTYRKNYTRYYLVHVYKERMANVFGAGVDV